MLCMLWSCLQGCQLDRLYTTCVLRLAARLCTPDASGDGLSQAAALGGLGKVSFLSQLCGTALAIVIALVGGCIVYWLTDKAMGLRLNPEEEFTGADLTIHKVSATPENESGW